LGRPYSIGNLALNASRKDTTMLQNAFAGQAKRPTSKALAAVLADTQPLWDTLVADLTREFHIDKQEWHTSSVKLGWSLRLQRAKRNIVYLGPRGGFFIAAFALGDKAVAAARKTELPARVLKIIAGAKRYAEGTAVRIEVKSAEDLDAVKMLARIKVEN
jgi:hypothetical protein